MKLKVIRTIYDTVIIGAGPSGVQAGLYLLRANKKVLFFHDYSQGSLVKAEKIGNLYAQGEVSGIDLYNKGIKDVKKLGADIIESLVTFVEYDYENQLFVVCDNNVKVKAKTIILAIGKQIIANPKYKINTNEKISYCATCDGFFYRNKKVALIGNSEYTFAEYNHLLNVTSDITILTNEDVVCDELKNVSRVITKNISSINLDKNKNIKIIFKDRTSQIFDGVFIAEGHFGLNALASTLGVYSENGFIIVNEKMGTNVQGVFACGDAIGGTFQISKAMNDGMITGLSVISYLNSKN